MDKIREHCMRNVVFSSAALFFFISKNCLNATQGASAISLKRATGFVV